MKIEFDNFIGQPCNSRTAYEFVPKREYSLNLELLAKKLREKEVFIEIETPYLLMLKFGGKDVSIFKSGKIIVKSTNKKENAKKIATSLIKKINN
jgi:ArsR family metal-binding transcriptional regulator